MRQTAMKLAMKRELLLQAAAKERLAVYKYALRVAEEVRVEEERIGSLPEPNKAEVECLRVARNTVLLFADQIAKGEHTKAENEPVGG